MIWTCPGEGQWIFGYKDAEFGAGRQESRVVDVVKEDVKLSWCERRKDAEHWRVRWRQVIG